MKPFLYFKKVYLLNKAVTMFGYFIGQVEGFSSMFFNLFGVLLHHKLSSLFAF